MNLVSVSSVKAYLRRVFEDCGCIINPLVALRRRDDAALPFFTSPEERAAALPILEEMSARLWHMAVSADDELLSRRLVEQPDNGRRYLTEITSLAELIGGCCPDLDDIYLLDVGLESLYSVTEQLEQLLKDADGIK